MNAIDAYFSAVVSTLDHLQTTQRDALERAASWLAETLQADGLFYVTGSGHSHMIAEEVFYRAGGLAAVQPLLDPALMLHEGAVKSSAVERLEGFARTVMGRAGVGPDDLLLVASNSGRNAFPVEIALEAKGRGCRTVAVTSLAHSRRVDSRHSSGRRLFEVADLTLDTGVPYGDASVAIDGLAGRIGPLSSLAGVALVNAVVVRAVELCVGAGHSPDVFVSANLEGGDQPLDLAAWRRRIRGL